MLGRYNAQGLGESVENLTKEFVVTEGIHRAVESIYLTVIRICTSSLV